MVFAQLHAEQGDADISFYTGTFDIIDEEGDDQTTLFGIEHKNSNLFRDTFLGKFQPITGGFMTGNSSVYLYTGIEGQYGIGPLKILPSFAPGYYEKGDGKDLGSVLEFKSEVKIGLRSDKRIEILAGLDEGDIIVAEGLKKVRPKGKIKPISK